MDDLTTLVEDGGELYRRKKDGSMERLIITGLRGA